MSWAFQPLLPGAAHQQSDPNAVSISEAASAADSCDAVVYKLYSDSVTEAAGGLIDAGVGYTAGGQDSSNAELGSIEKVTFSTGAVGAVTATISTRSDVSGVESSSKAYFAGGWAGGGPTAEIDGIVFATEAANNPSAALNVARFFHTGVQSTTKGYWLAGNNNATTVTEIDGIVFSTDTANNPSASLDTATDSAVGVSSSTVGYACSGNAVDTDIQGVTFSTDAAYATSAALARK